MHIVFWVKCMNWKQVVAGIFSLVAVFFYLQQEPELTVSSVYSNIVNLYFVNEKQEVYVAEKEVVCTNTLDCILKSHEDMDIVIHDMVLEEGELVIDVNCDLTLSKRKEAFLWYLLQFDDVDKVKVYLNGEFWNSGLVYDSKQVFSSHFDLFTSDLYMSTPLVIYENIDGYEVVRTIRIPKEEKMDRIISWILYVYGESVSLFDGCEENDGLIVSLKGKMNDESHIKSLGNSLLLLVDKVVILHDEIEVFRK